MSAVEALAWLRATLERLPALEELRNGIPVLDGEVAAAAIAGALDRRDNPWPLIKDLERRYPKNSEPLYVAGRALESNAFAPVPLALFEAARERGAFEGREDRRDTLAAYIQRQFETNGPGSGVGRPTHALFLAVFGAASSEDWARRTIKTTHAGRLIENAWSILRNAGDPLVADPEGWYAALHAIIDGFDDLADADASLERFKRESDPTRRDQALGLHRWVMNPGMSWGGSHRKLVQRNLEQLEQDWSIDH